ncbi:MFS general substrate transporter [Myriangium duriaei CBS 260.36]|uniref:MFS general substrate transporter n=1 Tax=Myriangium duriaei CBS 260.36 TaxID=1168546 RepID=A0A9P4J5Q0_9PEZI|nr:MFS general substrate transporter [Myriangium duriaei CBS 260.36]
MTTEVDSITSSRPCSADEVEVRGIGDGLPPPSNDIRYISWDGPSDPENPFNWPRSRKLLITVLCLVATFSCNVNATALTVAWRETNAFYGISDAHFPNSYWTIASWTLGGSVFMMLFLALIEDHSVKWGYLISYALFIIFTIPQAVVQSFAGVVVLRFFAGGCVSLVANCIAGICCDIWAGERSRLVPIASYVTLYLQGSAAGPVIGAAILTRFDWRWIIWLQVIWNAVLLLMLCATLRETRGMIILRQRAKLMRKATGQKVYSVLEVKEQVSVLETLKVSVKRPFYLFLTEWVVFSFTLWSSFSVGLVYLFTQSTELVFSQLYGWSSVQCGFVQAAVVIGMLLAWVTNFYSIHLYFASSKRNKEKPDQPIPEAYLYLSVFGCFVGILGGMFVYGWTSYPSVPWIAPAIGLAMVGYGINNVVIAIGNYVTACYSKYAISAVAAVASGENIFAALLPLATSAMYTKLGLHWPSSMLGLFAILLGLAPIVMMGWGQSIRAKSPFISEACYEDEDVSDKSSEPQTMA